MINLSNRNLVNVSQLIDNPLLVKGINASCNSIINLEQFSIFLSLEYLDLHSNFVSNIDDLASLMQLKNLTQLNLSDNPISQSEDFRLHAIRLLPKLRMLNSVAVLPDETVEANIEETRSDGFTPLNGQETLLQPTLTPQQQLEPLNGRKSASKAAADEHVYAQQNSDQNLTQVPQETLAASRCPKSQVALKQRGQIKKASSFSKPPLLPKEQLQQMYDAEVQHKLFSSICALLDLLDNSHLLAIEEVCKGKREGRGNPKQ